MSHTYHELCPSSKPLIILNNLPKHLEANRLKFSTVCLFIKDQTLEICSEVVVVRALRSMA